MAASQLQQAACSEAAASPQAAVSSAQAALKQAAASLEVKEELKEAEAFSEQAVKEPEEQQACLAAAEELALAAALAVCSELVEPLLAAPASSALEVEAAWAA